MATTSVHNEQEPGERGLGEAPPSFSLGIDQTIATLKEEGKGKGKGKMKATVVTEVPRPLLRGGSSTSSEGIASELSELTLGPNLRAETKGGKEADLGGLTEELEKLHCDSYKALIEFLEEDPGFQKALAEGGSNPSASVNGWARNRLQKFREWKEMANRDVPFEQLDPAECSLLLTKFFEQVKKKDGTLYPTQTLMGLYRAFHRMLRRAQEVRIQSTGKDEPPFSMRASPMFKPVGISCVLSMERSRKAGANQPRKKAEVISLSDEAVILSHMATNPTYPRGLQRRALYYLLCYMGIRGGSELYNLTKDEFTFCEDDNGPYIRFDERLSKNYKVSLDRYQDEQFREPVTCYNTDFIATMKALIDRLSAGCTFIFCQAIDSPSKHAWFSSLRVASRKLANGMKDIHSECGLVVEANITNKSGRMTCVTRMAAEGVPTDVGMRVTGHKSETAYKRYDRSKESQVRAAHKCIEEGTTYAENVKVATELFRKKVLRGEAMSIEEETSPPERVKLEVGGTDAVCGFGPAKDGDSAANMEDSSVPDPPKRVSAHRVSSAASEMEVSGAEEIVNEEKEDTPADEESWMDTFDWDKFMAPFDRPAVIVNPVTAVFNKIRSLSNCTVNISIGNLRAG